MCKKCTAPLLSAAKHARMCLCMALFSGALGGVQGPNSPLLERKKEHNFVDIM